MLNLFPMGKTNKNDKLPNQILRATCWRQHIAQASQVIISYAFMGQTKGGSSQFGLQIEQVHPKNTTAQVDLGRVSSCIQGDSFSAHQDCHLNYKCTNLLTCETRIPKRMHHRNTKGPDYNHSKCNWTQHYSSLTSCNQIHEHILMVANFPGTSACYPLCIQDHLQGYLMHILSRRYLIYSVCSVSNLTTARRFDKN